MNLTEFFQNEIAHLKQEHTQITNEYLDSLDRRLKATPWKTQMNICKARIERFETFLASLNA